MTGPEGYEPSGWYLLPLIIAGLWLIARALVWALL